MSSFPPPTHAHTFFSPVSLSTLYLNRCSRGGRRTTRPIRLRPKLSRLPKPQVRDVSCRPCCQLQYRGQRGTHRTNSSNSQVSSEECPPLYLFCDFLGKKNKTKKPHTTHTQTLYNPNCVLSLVPKKTSTCNWATHKLKQESFVCPAGFLGGICSNKGTASVLKVSMYVHYV